MKKEMLRGLQTVGIAAIMLAVVIGWWGAAVAQTESAAVAAAKTLTRFYEPIEVTGKYLMPLVGKQLLNLRLYAVKENKLAVIPFQFDERTPQLKFALPMGEMGNPGDANNIFDAQDILMFMSRDTGDRLNKDFKVPGADEMMEIEVTEPQTNNKGWVYLIYNSQLTTPPKLEKTIYLEHDKAFVVGSRYYGIQGFVNKHGSQTFKTCLPEKIWTPPEAGGSGKNFIDRVKFRAEARILFGTVSIKANETNVFGRVDMYKIGPVRVFGRNWASINLPMGLSSPKLWADIFCYDTFLTIPIKTKVPVNPKVFLTDATMSMGYDLNYHAMGMRFFNSRNPKGFLVEGKMTPEKEKMDNRLDDWRGVTGPQGTVITCSIWDKRYAEQAKITVNYIDDLQKMVPPEGIPGQIGYHYNQSKVTSMNPGTYETQFNFFFPPNFYDPRRLKVEVIEEFLQIWRNPLSVSVGGQNFKNNVGHPPYLSPKFN